MLKKISIAFGLALFFGGYVVVSASGGILKITEFSANPSSINPGQSSTLKWKTELATKCEARNFTGWGQTESLESGKAYNIPVNGSVSIKPSGTNTYQITCSSPYSSTSKKVTVTVNGTGGGGGDDGGGDGVKMACEDGIDNDGDGKTDYPSDLGCTEAKDNDESRGGVEAVVKCLADKNIEIKAETRTTIDQIIADGKQLQVQSKKTSYEKTIAAIQAEYTGILSTADMNNIIGNLRSVSDSLMVGDEPVTKQSIQDISTYLAATTRASSGELGSCVTLLGEGAPMATDTAIATTAASTAALTAAPAAAPASVAISFTRNLSLGSEGDDVLALQKILNSNPATRIAAVGAGSPGQETSYFGTLTQTAVKKFQELNADKILVPLGLSSGTGYVGESTRAVLNTMVLGTSTSTGTTLSPTQQASADSIQAQIDAITAQVAVLQAQLAAQMPAGS